MATFGKFASLNGKTASDINERSRSTARSTRRKKDVHKAVESQAVAFDENTPGGKITATMNTVIDRYLKKEEFPVLAHWTQGTNKSLIELHIRPKWSDMRPSEWARLRSRLGLKNCRWEQPAKRERGT